MASGRGKRPDALLARANKNERAKIGKNDMSQESKLDIQRILAEREQRAQEIKNLPELESPAFSSIHLLTDSQMFESSQDSSQATPKVKLNSLYELDVFNQNQVFRLFSEDQVNFSWIDKDSSLSDVPPTRPPQLLEYLRTELVAHFRRSTQHTLACRYVFFLMSVTGNGAVMEVCHEILQEKIGSSVKPFSIPFSDVLIVLMNYGTLKSKLIREEKELTFPRGIQARLIDRFDEKFNNDRAFPYENLLKVLEVLRFNLETYPAFTESDKILLFHMILNLAQANGINCEWTFFTEPIMPVIKQVLSSILASFTDEEWQERRFAKVEDLAMACWINGVDHNGIVQRIQTIPTFTLRGIQLQQSAAHYAVQNLMDFETVHLMGKIMLTDVVDLLTAMLSKNSKDYGLSYSCAVLISMCIDLDDETQNRDLLKDLSRMITDWRHSIRDIANDLDDNRLAIKDFLTELSTMWNLRHGEHT